MIMHGTSQPYQCIWPPVIPPAPLSKSFTSACPTCNQPTHEQPPPHHVQQLNSHVLQACGAPVEPLVQASTLVMMNPAALARQSHHGPPAHCQRQRVKGHVNVTAHSEHRVCMTLHTAIPGTTATNMALGLAASLAISGSFAALLLCSIAWP